MSTAAALQSDIKKAFTEVGLRKVDKDTMSKCVALASTLRLTPNQMATCWEAFKFNKKNVTTLNESCFSAYRNALIKESDSIDQDVLMDTDNETTGAIMTRANTATGRRSDLPNVTPPAKRFHGVHSSGPQPTMDSATSRRASSGRRVSLSPGPPIALQSAEKSSLPTYSDRLGVGQIVATFDPNHLESNAFDDSKRSSPRCAVQFESIETNVTTSYRHMFTTLDERAKALDHALMELGQQMVDRYNLGDEDDANVAPLEAVGVPRQDKICCIGRICNSAHEGRLNATSVLLEGSRHTSGGARIELDLSHLQSNKISYSLFPGQIVAVEGMNTTGRKMVAHRICEGVAPVAPTSTVKDLLRFHHDDEIQGGKPLSLVAVAGPYTTSDDLGYQPLVDLVNRISKENADVVILTGPFVDLGHNLVQSGQTVLHDNDTGEDVLVPYDTFFAHKIAAVLEDVYAGGECNTQFVLVPSLEDATAEWVYPQPPMKDRIRNNDGTSGVTLEIPGADLISIGTLGLDFVEIAGREQRTFRRVHCVPNPCTLKINELVIGITSTDVLFHVSADETNANLEPGSRLVRISQHMIQQQSYYPLFPSGPCVNLDLNRSDHWRMPCKPDILIVPSKLNPFAKPVLDSTVVVNPGRLTRDTTGGTYATIAVHPINRDTLENSGGDDVEIPHNVHQRSRIEIKKI